MREDNERGGGVHMCVCVCVRYDSVHLSMKLRQSGVRVYIQRERER